MMQKATVLKMNNGIHISSHYNDRYRERIARTKRIEKFANDAYIFGRAIDNVQDTRLRKYLIHIDENHDKDCTLRVYKGFIHVFDALTLTAITVYRVPNKFALR